MGKLWQRQTDISKRILLLLTKFKCSNRYAHVSPECMERSPTNMWWQEWRQSGASKQHAEAVVEEHADYDGIAVVWGIGHFKQTVEGCAEACRTYESHLQLGGQAVYRFLHYCYALDLHVCLAKSTSLLLAPLDGCRHLEAMRST